MSTCDNAGCAGHLGKFQSCLSEALWEASLEGSDRTTGSSEFEGHFALQHYPDNETATLGNGVTVDIPNGWYIVETAESGAVWTSHYPSEAEALRVFNAADERYGEWLDTEESEDEEPEPYRHMACRFCGTDIEGLLSIGEWRDRGNNTRCAPWTDREGNTVTPTFGQRHEPYIPK